MKRKSVKAMIGAVRWRAIIARDNAHCVYCGRNLKDHPNLLQIDHLDGWAWEKALEYTERHINRSSNLVVSCSTCNRRKACQSLETFVGDTKANEIRARAAMPLSHLRDEEINDRIIYIRFAS